MEIGKFFDNVGKGTVDVIDKHGASMLLVTGILSTMALIPATIIATKQTEKHLEEAVENKIRNSEDDDISLTKVEVVKACWKDWIKVGVVAGTAVGSEIGSFMKQAKKISLLGSTVSMMQEQLKNHDIYKEVVQEKVGKKKAAEIEEEADIRAMETSHMPTNNSMWIETGEGDQLFIDLNTGERFKSDINAIKGHFIEFNQEVAYSFSTSWSNLTERLYHKTSKLLDSLEYDSNMITPTQHIEPRFGHKDYPELGIRVHTLSYPMPCNYIA